MSKRIIVTGTSRGIGIELVKQLAEQGHQVLALSRNEKPCIDLKLNNVTALSFDLSSEEDLSKVATFIEKEWQTVDALIHNAGALVNKPFEKLSAADFQRVYEVNVFGVAQLTQAVLPFMNAGSHVLTISSMGGVQGSAKFPGLAAYSSSKGAVITLSELLAEEYKEQGIAFNVLALGAVQTEMLEEAFPGYQAPLQPDEMAAYIANFALTAHKFYNGKVLQVSASTP
ncbi:SDR family NAD(P)-dependent oxidoreductase [Leeuwenhoekiella parthenopeia]|uniref:SDR family oxidoreductase n=1 Tax=Leeuwenhoekiella parthenopeia TaxID=2890320 RepID=A0ABS8GRE6_9FLAO|nr:SDR family oxidoreductase [Leeuwenhoekiella parthenopeia]MCC4212556.1 SDR family oxidoreductase [Leeuwenhoekiella parthenopeia]